MIAPCAAPIATERLVAYWAGDLSTDESDGVDEHVMGCGTCAAASARVAAVTEALRAMIPPVLTRGALAALLARGLRVVENPVARGARQNAVFSPGVDILLHQLQGLDLTRATRVGVTVGVEETGEVLLEIAEAPFDRDAGEVLIACQRHFAAFPPNVTFEVSVHDTAGAEDVARYVIPHRFVRP